MRIDRSVIVVLSVVVFLPIASRAQDASKPSRSERVINQLVEAHNKERSKAGLGPLKLEDHLVEAAKIHAKDMAEHDVMTHDGSDGSNAAQRVTRAGYHYLNTGENVAHGYRIVPEVMKAWMESPPHKKNILNGEFSEIGVAVVYSDEGKPYWCAEFGKPIPKFEPATATSELVTKINNERTTAKQSPMAMDPKLSKAAQEQAEKLAKANGQGNKSATFEGIDQKAYRDIAVSAASGHPDAAAMVKNLIETPELKTQILGKYARIGTGYTTAEDGTPFWCVILANPARGR